jgi:hypothetical protein
MKYFDTILYNKPLNNLLAHLIGHQLLQKGKSTNRLFLLTVGIVFAGFNSIKAQNISLSPYSRFGLGSLEPVGATNHFAMGGLTMSYLDPYTINPGNPAANAYLRETTFQFSARSSFLKLTNDNSSTNQQSTQINDISFAFKPENKRWAIVMGIAPYSYTGYNLDVADTSTSPQVKYNYQGQGGINKANFGYSRYFRLFKGPKNQNGQDSSAYDAHSLSFGANMNYYFGTVKQIRKVIFDDITYANSRYTNSTRLSQVSGELGMHYMMPLHVEVQNKKIYRASHISLGATYTMGGDFSAKYSEIGESYYLFSTAEIPIDTSFYLAEVKGSVHVPEKIGLGLSYHSVWNYDRNLFMGVEYEIQDWSTYAWLFEGQETKGNFKEASNLSFGMQYQPSSKSSEERLFARSTYRFGVRHTETFLDFDGTSIAQNAVSAGISMPLKASLSYSQIHIGFEYGQGGTTQNNLIQEDFIHFQIGFSLTPHIFNKWFLQRKYE